MPRGSNEGSEQKTAAGSPKGSGTKSPVDRSPSGHSRTSKGIELVEVHNHDHEEEEPCLEEDALPDPTVNPDADFQPPKPEKYKAFVPIEISNFQIIRLHFTPRCLFTYY